MESHPESKLIFKRENVLKLKYNNVEISKDERMESSVSITNENKM